jgi:hypothetical protein
MGVLRLAVQMAEQPEGEDRELDLGGLIFLLGV